MPIRIEGVENLKRAIRKFDPDLYKEMNKEIAIALKSVTKEAKLATPNDFLSGAMGSGERKSRTSSNRAFPVYDASAIRRGLTYSMARKRGNVRGWISTYSLLNKSAIGAIAEIAGTKNPFGSPRSRSNNPQAGRQFIDALNRDMGSVKEVGKGRGRLMYAALADNQGKARDAVIAAIDKATKRFMQVTR